MKIWRPSAGVWVTDDRQRALAEFRDLAAQEADMLSQLRLIEASLQRLTLRAPAHGVVHDLQIVTEGGGRRAGADP